MKLREHKWLDLPLSNVSIIPSGLITYLLNSKLKKFYCLKIVLTIYYINFVFTTHFLAGIPKC